MLGNCGLIFVYEDAVCHPSSLSPTAICFMDVSVASNRKPNIRLMLKMVWFR
jgi:hypothetical protein